MSADPIAAGNLSASRIAELLAPTLGVEKSKEVVDAAVTRLRLDPHAHDLSLDQALAILDDLGRAPGMVGIAARFARTRLDAPKSGPVSVRHDAAPVSSARGAITVSSDEVAALLAGVLGAARSQEVVARALSQLGLPRDRLDKAQAMMLLDHLAQEPGSLGLCARFGKARLILRFAA
jgi:hypothetical protein